MTNALHCLAEVHIWPICCPSVGFGGSAFCHPSHVPQRKDSIPELYGSLPHREGFEHQVLAETVVLPNCTLVAAGAAMVPQLALPARRDTTTKVLGSSGKLYTCYSSCHFCTCPAFGFTVLQKSESLLCKHILAVYLSQAMGACQELSVSEEQLTSILLAEEEDEG
ncbi:zinc finger SWIM domain-containing protein 7 isoform 7-T7 [Leptosomus discolor]